MPGRTPIRRRPWVERFWSEQLPWYEVPGWAALTPLSLAYGAAVAARNRFWHGRKQRAEVRTVSVGNLTVGGNGKTPFTLFLARRLQMHGFSVGIVTRGFGRRGSGRARARMVSDGSRITLSPGEAGDEPVMLARSFSGPVVVAKRRIDAIDLLKQTAANLDFVILDDAFQHVRLARDVDLLLVSRERGLGNGWMLPAGPMRERIGAAKRADAVILMSWGTADPSALSERQMAALSQRPLLTVTLRAHSLVAVDRGCWVEYPADIAGRRVLAVSGLADPSGFYAMLRAIDADLVGVLAYPDHHRYTGADWQTIVHASREAEMIVTSEKDLVKLERFPFARDSLYALRLEVTMGMEDARKLDELVIGPAGGAQAAVQG